MQWETGVLCSFHSVMTAHFSWCIASMERISFPTISLSLSLWDIRKHLVREPCDKGFNSFSHFITQCSLKSEDVFPLHRCSHFLCCFCSLCFLLLPSMAFFICNSRFIMLPPFVPFILLVFLPLKVRAFVLFFSFPSQFVFFVSRTEWWQ